MNSTRILRICSVLLLPALLLGCTRMKVVELCDQPRPPLPHGTRVQVYQDVGEVPGAFEEIAVLEITSAVTRKRMLSDIQRRAAGLGADGIVLEQAGKHEEPARVFTGDLFIPIAAEYWDGRALAIRMN